MNNQQVLQNKAAKLVLDRPLYSSANDALNQLGWLNSTGNLVLTTGLKR